MPLESTRPTAFEICDKIVDYVGEPQVTLETIAVDLHSSRSQIQRALRESGLSFREELRRERLVKAAELLIEKRCSVAEAAAGVGVSADHLCVMFTKALGIGPGEVRRVVELAERIDRWNGRVPAEFGTRGYRRERKEWDRTEREMRRLLSKLHADSELASWAQQTLRAARRPDHRRQPYRARVHEARRRERDEFQRLLKALMREASEARNAGATTHPRGAHDDGVD